MSDTVLKYTPAVFAVGDTYQIMAPVTAPSLFWVEIDGKCYYDEQNGIMRSLCTTHRVTVPMEALDRAGSYTVCEREIIDRKPYFPETHDTVRTEFDFTPVPEGEVRIYHIADTHNTVIAPVDGARQFGKIDLLVLNGDIINHSGEIAYFDTIYKIAQQLTAGGIPIVFARGNHDLRGYFAEQISDHVPNSQGRTYFTFRLGCIWGLVLDCGEDKDDSSNAYGHTVACHDFRLRQTEYIKSVIANAETEYEADGVRHKLIISHAPFTYVLHAPFNIESDIYREWAALIKEHIKPELMLSGHLHQAVISEVGSEYDHLGQPCKLVIGSDMGTNFHVGCGVVLSDNGEAKIEFYRGNK